MVDTVKRFVVKDQVGFCSNLMDRLHDSVFLLADNDCPDCISYGAGLTEEGASKTQIKQDIVRLRRELNKLSRLVE